MDNGLVLSVYELLPLAVDVCNSYVMFMSVLHLLIATACT